MNKLTQLLTNIFNVTRFRCTCINSTALKTDMGSHTIRICDPNFYNSNIITNTIEALNTITNNMYCKGPWKSEHWAIAPPNRNILKSNIKPILYNKPQLYPKFFDIAITTGQDNTEVIEHLKYVIPATINCGIVIGILPTKPSIKSIKPIAKLLNPFNIFIFDEGYIILGQPSYRTPNTPISVYETTQLQQIIDTLKYATLDSYNYTNYSWSIIPKNVPDPRSNIEPIAQDVFDPEHLPTYLMNDSIWTNKKHLTDIFDNTVHNKLEPIEPLLAGHLGLLLPVGYLNNRIIYKENSTKDPIIIKGSVEKFEEIIEEQPKKIVTEENYEIRVTTMNLITGEINNIGQEDDLTLPEFLEENRDALYQTAKTIFPPSVDYTHKDIPKFIDRLKDLKRTPVGKQGATIISLASHIRDNKNAFCIGQQGSGKTFIALGVTKALQYNKILVMCPTHAIETWKREIKETIKDAVILKPSGISGTKHTDTQIPLDKINSLKCDNPTFILLPKDISKLGFTEKLNVRYSTLYRNQYGKICNNKVRNSNPEKLPKTCPRCDSTLKLISLENSTYTIECTNNICRFPKQITCPTCWQPIKDPLKLLNQKKITKKIYCTKQLISFSKNIPTHKTIYTKCNTILTSPDTNARFHHKIPYGEYIAKYLPKWCDLFIIDELHQYKGKNSLQTKTAGKIAQKAKKTLGLTGTFMGGYASNLYWLFEHFIPRFPVEGLEWNKETKFIELFGKYKHTYKMNRQQFNRMMTGTMRKQTGQRTQIPGYHPELLKFILPTSVFVNIYDINRELAVPEIYAKILPLDKKNTYSTKDKALNQCNAYFMLKDAMENNAIERIQKGETYNSLALLHELITYPENCWMETSPKDSTTKKPIIDIPEIILKKGTLFPKEEELIKIIENEIKENRKCLIYCTHTNEKATWKRITQLINNKNIKCAFMSSKGPAENRLIELEKLANENNVVIIQPQAVETGLNLQQFPTIIWYEPHLSIYTSEQASARSHRINQDQQVRIYYLAYADTYQERQLKLLADKRDVSSTITGTINEDSLSNLNAKQETLKDQLTKEFYNNYKFTDTRSVDERADEINKLFQQQRTQTTEQIKKDNQLLLDDTLVTTFKYNIVDPLTNKPLDIDIYESAPDNTPVTVTFSKIDSPFYINILKSADKQTSLF